VQPDSFLHFFYALHLQRCPSMVTP
jgi:hypothetical protein